MSFKELEGMFIEKIQINDNNDEIYFLVNVEKSEPNINDKDFNLLWPRDSQKTPYVIISYATHNDCCNEVWFSDFLNMETLLFSKILKIEEKGWTSTDEGGEDTVIESAFWTIQSTTGYADIEVRNEHNGYYGGYVSFGGLLTDFKKMDISDNPTLNQKKFNALSESCFLDYKLILKPASRKYKI